MKNKCENPELQVIVSAIEATNKVINVCNDAPASLKKELCGGINSFDLPLLSAEKRAQLKKEYIDKVDSIMSPYNSQVEDLCEKILVLRSYYVELVKKFIAYKDNQKVELSDIERLYFLSIADCSNEDMELCKRLVNEYKI